MVCRALGNQDWIPSRGEKLAHCCQGKIDTGRSGKDVRTLLILVLWELRKHRNAIVFYGVVPLKNYVITRIESEGQTWKQTGLIRGDVGSFLGVLQRGLQGGVRLASFFRFRWS